jgi:hypothetical protein
MEDLAAKNIWTVTSILKFYLEEVLKSSAKLEAVKKRGDFWHSPRGYNQQPKRTSDDHR